MILSDRQWPVQAVAQICRNYAVLELALFGSALREDFGEESDIDFLVEFEPTAQIGFLELAAMQEELSDVLKRSVDLVSKQGLNPVIRQSVLSSARVLYEA